MRRTNTTAPVRWTVVLAALAAASGLASPWGSVPPRPAPMTESVIRIVPRLYTSVSAQSPTVVCQKKPVAGEVMTYTMNSSTATTAGNVVHSLTTLPSNLNFAGLSGPAGLFATDVSLPAGSYTTITLVMSNVISVKGVVTCDPDGAGPLGTRTYYTGGNPSMTVPDPSVDNPAAANPLLTEITVTGGGGSFSMAVAFSVTDGVNTPLNITYNTDQGFKLWDVSGVSGVPQSYKIMPGDVAISSATVAP